MRGWEANIVPSKGLNAGAEVNIVDNSGVTRARIFSFFNGKGTWRRYPKGGIGNVARAVAVSGNSQMIGQRLYIYITNQIATFRYNGKMFQGDRNEAVVVTMKKRGEFLVQGTKILSPVYSFLKSRIPKILSFAKKVIYL